MSDVSMPNWYLTRHNGGQKTRFHDTWVDHPRQCRPADRRLWCRAAPPFRTPSRKTFSINFPSAEMMEKTDYCGLVSVKDVDKASLFDAYYGSRKTAP